MEQYDIHPRRNFLMFCVAVHLAGFFAAIVTDYLDNFLDDDTNKYVYFACLPLVAMPIAYLINYKKLTGESDSAVGKHFKEIGIWLLTVFPMGAILFTVLLALRVTEHIYSAAEYYLGYLGVCTLSIFFVTPLYKMGRMIISAGRKSDDDYYRYYGGM
ncbi:hypothetical protein [Ruminococcus sp.]|uniref:hypothetical protein n=1 Tax=Ruminococcus sp. TaxID=41978 RepID=UPI001B182037|nr:hypothetical protein [Ruminococcus sp.]MBO5558997.1 hypothetical protein [Ruminococcus sp.]